MIFKVSLSVDDGSINTSFVACIVAVIPFTVSSPVVKRNADVRDPLAAMVEEAVSLCMVKLKGSLATVVVVVAVDVSVLVL